MDWETILKVLAGIITGGSLAALLTAWLTLKKGTSEIRRSERADALAEWMQISSDRAADIQRLDKELTDLRKHHQGCLVKQARLEGEVESLRHQVEALTYDRHEENAEYTWVIATMDGIIRDAGGNVPQMLHRRPKDLIGQPITILLPPNDKELLEAHHKGMERAAAAGLVRSTAVVGHAITRDGVIIPVVVSLAATEWRGDPAIKAQIFEIEATSGSTILG